MVTDLPDYTKYIAPNPAVPESAVGPTYVAEYDSDPEDLVDETKGPLLIDIKGRLYVRLYGMDAEDGSLPIIPRPKGGILAKGSVTSTSSYATVATRTVTNAKTLQLAKIVISCSKAAWVQFRWDGTAFSAERLIDDQSILIEHFPWDYYPMPGNGSKSFDVQAKYESQAGTVNVEIVGEEVTA